MSDDRHAGVERDAFQIKWRSEGISLECPKCGHCSIIDTGKPRLSDLLELADFHMGRRDVRGKTT